MTATVLTGVVERFVVRDPKSRFAVAHLRLSSGEVVVVRGSLAGVGVDAPISVAGAWIDDRRWGRQFHAESYQLTTAPDSGRAEHADDSMACLRDQGVSLAYALRISKRYGPDISAVVPTDPYRLTREVWGVSFPVADSIADQLKIARDVPARLEAGLLHVLTIAALDGDLHLPDGDLITRTAELLQVGAEHLPPRLASLGAAQLIVREMLDARGACSALPALHAAEVEAAARLVTLRSAPTCPIAPDLGGAIDAFELATNFRLAPQQRLAVEGALRDACTVITGGPGVGKTTVVKAIASIVRANGKRVMLAAPTGRAAKRLAEVTDTEALTIHRLLEYQPLELAFRKSASDPLAVDVLVVDEASLIDLPLFRALLAATVPGVRLVLVGDADQLPSVGPGYVLGDVIASGAATVVRLTDIYRQAEASRIVIAAHKINAGELPDLAAPRPGEPPASDFYFVQREDADAARATVVDLVAERIPARFGIVDAQVLSPMYRGELGIVALNQALQARLNVHRDHPELVRGDRLFRLGDRVMQLRNDYERGIHNGDVGVVASVDPADGVLHIDFGDGRVAAYEYTDLDQLVHAYAISVHKSQASEYPAIVLALAMQHYVMLSRPLLYTALTRGKRLVVIVGSRRALARAVRAEARRRHTHLAERVRLCMMAGAP